MASTGAPLRAVKIAVTFWTVFSTHSFEGAKRLPALIIIKRVESWWVGGRRVIGCALPVEAGSHAMRIREHCWETAGALSNVYGVAVRAVHRGVFSVYSGWRFSRTGDRF